MHKCAELHKLDVGFAGLVSRAAIFHHAAVQDWPAGNTSIMRIYDLGLKVAGPQDVAGEVL